MYSLFSETLNGLRTIRTFNAVKMLTKTMERHIDRNSSLFLYFQLSSRWLALRLDGIGITMFACIAASLFISLGRNSTEFVGLGLVYSLQVTGLLQWTVRTFIETENNLVSVQRLSRYTDSIPVERYEDESSNASSSWPTQGTIQASNVKMKYRENLPEVLRDVSFEIRNGEKIGICGRTGSGKSSLFSTLLRIVESHSGKITIDGVDISKVGLKRLRSSIALIPQDPVMCITLLKYHSNLNTLE